MKPRFTILSIVLAATILVGNTGCATTAQEQVLVQDIGKTLQFGYADATIVLNKRWSSGKFTADDWNNKVVPQMARAGLAIATYNKIAADLTTSTQPSENDYFNAALDALNALDQIRGNGSGPNSGPPPTPIPPIPS